MPARKTKTRRRITKPPSARQLAARAKFVKMVRAKSAKKKTCNPARRRNKTIITKPKRVIVLNPRRFQVKKAGGKYQVWDSMVKDWNRTLSGNPTTYSTKKSAEGAAKLYNEKSTHSPGLFRSKQNPTKSTRRKYRNGYLDLVIMGHAKKTPDGWLLGGKKFAQGKGIVPASKRGYYLDKATGTVFSKKARNGSTLTGMKGDRRIKSPERSMYAGIAHQWYSRGDSTKEVTDKLRAKGLLTAEAKIIARSARSVKRYVKGLEKNVAQGFFDGNGVFHPIRSSSDYDSGTAGETGKKPVHTRSKKRKASLKKASQTARHKAETRRRKSTTSRLASRSLSRSVSLKAGSRTRNPITAAQGADIVRMKQYRPYMIVFGAFNPKTEEFHIYAKPDRRMMNSLARKGWEIHEAKTSNPSVKEIRKTFAGTVGKTQSVFAPIGTPKNVAKLGTLKLIDTESAKITPRGTVYLCADTKGKLHIVGSKNAPIYDGPAQSFGKISLIEYDAAKPHLYPGQGTIRFWHKLGEESGNKPTLYGDGKGGLKIKGGSYKITREGIRD